MFGHEGPVQIDDKGLVIGPCIIAKDEGPNMYATKLMGPGWHEFKLYPFVEPNLDILKDYGWISAKQARQLAMQAEVGIIWR